MGLAVARLWKVIGDVIAEGVRTMTVGASGVNTHASLHIFKKRFCIIVIYIYVYVIKRDIYFRKK